MTRLPINSQLPTNYVIALYIRLSIEDNKVESLSIENQKKVLYQYADALDEHGNMEILEFVDNGYSGANFERPAIQELLDLVRIGKINCILVKDFSRFGRNSIEVGYFMERVFPLYGIRFISINDDFDSSRLHGDTGGIDVAFKYLISEFYSRDLSMKYKSAKYIKMKRGEYQSVICPYGYQKSTDGRMKPDPETAPIVQFIFEMAAQGQKIKQILKLLFERGIPTPGEYKVAQGQGYHDISRCMHIWDKTTVLRLLRDERYTGMYIAGKWKVKEVGGKRSVPKDESEWFKIADHHPALISKEVFNQVQIKLGHIKCNKKNVPQYPLRGKVVCGICRHSMQRTNAKEHAFTCRYTRIDEDSLCYKLKIMESELETMIYDVIAKQAQVILNLDDFPNTSTLEIQSAKQVEYSKTIAKYQDKKREFYEQFLLQEISLENYKEEKFLVDQELNRLKRCYEALCTQIEQHEKNSESRSERKKLAEDISGAGRLTSELVDHLIDKVYVYPRNQIEIIWKMKDFYLESKG